MSITMLC